MTDRLEGYRGERPTALRKALQDKEPQEGVPKPYARFVLGIEAEKLMAGVATRDNITHVMAAVISECEARVREATLLLLNEPDLSSEKARTTHFDARVAAGILGTLNSMITSGRLAGQELQGDTDDPA